MIRKNGRSVTFVLDAQGRIFERVSVVGDFNNWQPPANPMARQPDGTYAATIDLPAAGEYEFRYFADDAWLNDPSADAERPNSFGSSNCVVRIEIPAPSSGRLAVVVSSPANGMPVPKPSVASKAKSRKK
jgi:1,4-alpha-glucan branching enzyme